MTDLDTHNGHTETDSEQPEDAGKLTVQDFAAKVLSELKTLGPSDRLTVLDLIRQALDDQWSGSTKPASVRAYKIAVAANAACNGVKLAQHALSAIIALLPAADQVGRKSDVIATLDVQRQYVALAAETTKARSTVARTARKPKGTTKRPKTLLGQAAADMQAMAADPAWTVENNLHGTLGQPETGDDQP